MQTSRDKLLSVGLAKVISMPLGFITSVILARLMGPEVFGQYVFAFTVLSLLALPAGAAFGQLVMREVANASDAANLSLLRGFTARCWQWVISVSLLLILLLVLGASFSSGGLIVWGALIIPLMAMVTLQSETLRGLGFVAKSQWPDLVIRPLIFLMLVLSLATTEKLDPQSVLLSYTVALAVVVIYLQWLLAKKSKHRATGLLPSYDDERWLKAVPWFFTISLTAALLNQVPIVILGVMGLPSEQLSALQLALSFSLLVGLPMVVINLVMGPELAKLLSNESKRDAINLASRMTRLGLLLCFPLGVTVALFSELIVVGIYGSDYGYATTVVTVLALSALLNVAFGPLSYVLTLSGFERQAAAGQLLGLFIMSLAIIVSARELGSLGGAMGVFLGTAARNILLVVMCGRYLKTPWSLLLAREGIR